MPVLFLLIAPSAATASLCPRERSWRAERESRWSLWLVWSVRSIWSVWFSGWFAGQAKKTNESD